MIICTDCTKSIYRSEYDEDNCCVPNPYYDPNSNNPYRVDSVLSVNLAVWDGTRQVRRTLGPPGGAAPSTSSGSGGSGSVFAVENRLGPFRHM